MTSTPVYTDVEIRILKKEAEGYPVEITLTDKDGNKRYLTEGSKGHLEAKQWTSTGSPAEDGQGLFAWLFADEKLKIAWGKVSEHRPHRVRLRIDVTTPELHAVPWELMREPVGGKISRNLAADADTPFSRYPVGDWPPEKPIADRPIKILVAVANADNLEEEYNLTQIDVGTERGIIADAFSDLTQGQVQLSLLEQPVTLTKLETKLKQGYDFLHIVAHGKFSEKKKEAAILLADDENQVKRESEGDFAEMIDRLEQAQRPKFIFLASCQSASRDTADAFRGLAPRLIEVGVPVILAMQDSVPIKTAQEFARTFYRQLFQHGQVDLAGNEARSALLTGDFPGSSIPVLFSRLADNQLLAPLPDAVIEIEPFEPETVYIPAGEFLMGSQPGEGIPVYETPQTPIHLPAYRIGKYPVTNREYAEFIKHNKQQKIPTKEWIQRKPPADKLNYPVVAVSWYDAVAYCQWLGEQTGRCYRLPTEAEWEKAARGTEGQLYPWGNDWGAGYSVQVSSKVTPIIRHCDGEDVPYYPEGTSPFGCYDMVGNVQEWTSTLWGTGKKETDYPYPYDAEDGREDLSADQYLSSLYRVYRGGPVRDGQARLWCSTRDRARPENATKERGFRVVLDI